MNNCPQCNSPCYVYVKEDSQLGCLECGYRPDFYGKPLFYDLPETLFDFTDTNEVYLREIVKRELGLTDPTRDDIERWIKGNANE